MDPSAKPHILAVDNDVVVRGRLAEYLAENEMRVTTCASGREMFEVIECEAIDLVLLEWKLSGEDGMQLARTLRERGSLPIVLLTGRSEEADRVMGLELGADDYVTKPFSPRELLARIRAVLRRYRLQATLPERDNARRAFRFCGWELNLRTRRLTSPEGKPVELSNGEFSLLSAFCRAPERALSREQLLSMSRLNEAEVYDRTVDSQVHRLRARIERDPAHPVLIVTERGAGYRFTSPVDSLW